MFEELCKKAIEILEENKIRKSARSLFDVFFGMFNDGNFEGIKDTFGFTSYFSQNGNRKVAEDTKAWFNRNCSKTAISKVQKMTVVSVGELLEETDKAYKFFGGKYTNGQYGLEKVGIWVPKSQVSYNADNDTLEMPIWLAKENNYMRTY